MSSSSISSPPSSSSSSKKRPISSLDLEQAPPAPPKRLKSEPSTDSSPPPSPSAAPTPLPIVSQGVRDQWILRIYHQLDQIKFSVNQRTFFRNLIISFESSVFVKARNEDEYVRLMEAKSRDVVNIIEQARRNRRENQSRTTTTTATAATPPPTTTTSSGDSSSSSSSSSSSITTTKTTTPPSPSNLELRSQFQACWEVIRTIQRRAELEGNLSVQDTECLRACDRLLERLTNSIERQSYQQK